MKLIPFTENFHSFYPVGEHIKEAIEYIHNITPFIKEIVQNKDLNIWCRGSSGAILAALLAQQFNDDNNVVVLHVKKDGESSHQGNNFNYNYGGIDLIIDDFIRSGKTVNNIYEVIHSLDLKVNILVVGDYSGSSYRLDFKPDYFITDQYSVDALKETI